MEKLQASQQTRKPLSDGLRDAPAGRRAPDRRRAPGPSGPRPRSSPQAPDWEAEDRESPRSPLTGKTRLSGKTGDLKAKLLEALGEEEFRRKPAKMWKGHEPIQMAVWPRSDLVNRHLGILHVLGLPPPGYQRL